MTKAADFKPGQRIKVDGLVAVILDVLSSQLFVEWEGSEGLTSFVIIKDHNLEVE